MSIKIVNQDVYDIRRDCGVYLLRCVAENKIYVGSTKQSFRARFSNHFKFLKSGKLGNKALQTDYNKYGYENFEFEILGVYREEECVMYEKHFIESLKPFYNVIKASNNSKTNLNKKFSKDHVEKLRQAAKRYRHSPETLKIVSDLNKKNVSRYKLTNIHTGEVYYKTFTETVEFFQNSSFLRSKNRVYKKTWIIVKEKKQSKTIQLLIDGNWITFLSYEKCDKFLNKWRGYTSTQTLKGYTSICGYSVRIIQQDIV
jgi:group I intron endonuclease